jgi:putative endopeptidase
MVEAWRPAPSIQATEWMTAATKGRSPEKLNAFVVKSATPWEWKDYSKLTVSHESALNNLFADFFNTMDNLSKFGQPSTARLVRT